MSAYAFVVPGEVSLNVNPVLVDARSKNFDQVTSPAAGVFCLKPVRIDLNWGGENGVAGPFPTVRPADPNDGQYDWTV